MPVIYAEVSEEVKEMIGSLAKNDVRSETGEVAWLISQEYARRYSRPNPSITVEEAQAAIAAVEKPEK